MNSVVLTGRLTRDAELRMTTGGKSVASFTLAVDRWGNGVDFIPCVAWEKAADIISTYAGKGDKVGIRGRIQSRSYEDKTGAKRTVHEVVAEEIDLNSSRAEAAGVPDDDLPL